MSLHLIPHSSFFFFNDTATTEIYTLSLHDALPICRRERRLDPRIAPFAFDRVHQRRFFTADVGAGAAMQMDLEDRKSTRLNSSHLGISYAVFCLKKKKKNQYIIRYTFRRLGLSWFM